MRTARIAIVGLLILAISIHIALGIGVTPATVTEYFEPGMSKYVNIKILNPSGEPMQVTAHAEGGLAQYISFPITSVELKEGEKEKLISYRIQLPQELLKKGEIMTEIVLLAIPIKSIGDTKISANAEVVSRLKIVVPYDDLYAESKLYIPQLEKGVAADIIVEATNHGTKKIMRGFAIVDFYDSLNQKITFIKSEEFSLDPKKVKSITIPWNANLRSGNYRAVLTFVYDGKNAHDEKSFNVGEPQINIKDISIHDFNLGGIAEFDILLESDWNKQIQDVYGVVTVLDKNDDPKTTFKTPSVNVDAFGLQTLEAFWDTDAATAGNYQLKIQLNFLGKTTTSLYDIQVHPGDISVGPTGQVVTGGDKEGGTLNVITLLVLVILLLLVVIIGILFRKK